MRHVIITSTVAAVALGITGFVAYQHYFPPVVVEQAPPSPIIFQPTIPVVSADDPKIGAKNPKHTIIMFGDFQCGGCGDVAAELKTVLANHSDTQLVWKDAPNAELHQYSVNAAIAGRCANQQGKFWPFHDALFEAVVPDSNTINTAATNLKLDSISFNACLASDAVRKRVSSGLTLAETYGATATPFFFVDGKIIGVLNTAADFEPLLK